MKKGKLRETLKKIICASAAIALAACISLPGAQLASADEPANGAEIQQQTTVPEDNAENNSDKVQDADEEENNVTDNETPNVNKKSVKAISKSNNKTVKSVDNYSKDINITFGDKDNNTGWTDYTKVADSSKPVENTYYTLVGEYYSVVGNYLDIEITSNDPNQVINSTFDSTEQQLPSGDGSQLIGTHTTKNYDTVIGYHSEPYFTTMGDYYLPVQIRTYKDINNKYAGWKESYYYIVVHVTAPFELSDVSFNGEVGKEFSPAVKQSALTGNAKSVELAEVSLDEDAVKELEEKYGVKASAVRNGDNIDIMLEGTPTDEIVDYKIPINGKAEYIFWKLNRGPWYYFPTETARAYVTINVEKPVTTDNEVPQDPTGPEDPSDDPSTPVTTTTTGSGPMDSAPATGDDWSGMTAGLIGLIAAGGALAALRRRKERE